MLNHTIYLDVVPGGLPPIVHVSQFDEGSRTLLIHLYADTGELTIPDGATAKIRGTKRDKKGFDYTAALNGTTVVCDITRNMTAVSGRVYCEVAIISKDEELMTATFILMVKQSAFGEDVDISDSDLPDFYKLAQQIAEDAASAASSAAAAAESAQEAHKVTPEGIAELEDAISQAQSTVAAVEETVQGYGEDIEAVTRGNYFGDNRPSREMVYSKRAAMSTLSNDSDHSVLQGGCYVTETGHFVLAIVNSDEDSTVLVELDTDFETVIRRATLDLGHANDLTYNPNTGKIYVATGDTGTNANKIAVVNADTLTLESTLALDGAVKWLCSYDEVNDCYYTTGGGFIKTYNANWEEVHSIANDLEEYYAGQNELTIQSSFCYQGNFITLSFSKVVYSNSLQIFGHYLQLVDPVTGSVETLARYLPPGNDDEPEFVAVIGNVGYIFSGQMFLRVAKLYLGQEKMREPQTDIFGSAELIEQNGDLNDYLLPGCYYSPNTSFTGTLDNAPVSNGFTLYVIPVGRGVILHHLVNVEGRELKRIFGATSMKWLPWEEIDSVVGSRYSRVAAATTQSVTLNDGGTCFVILAGSNTANFYFISSSGGTAYVKTMVEQISNVTDSVSGLKVTFKSSASLTLFVFRLA